MVVGAARSAGHYRKPAGGKYEHLCTSGNQFAARRVHIAVLFGVDAHQHDYVSQPAIRRAAGHCAGFRSRRFPMVLVAHPSVPAKTVAELIAHAKANPGKVTMASFGTGSASHLAGELFNMMAGINLVHVPYRGSAPMMTDL